MGCNCGGAPVQRSETDLRAIQPARERHGMRVAKDPPRREGSIVWAGPQRPSNGPTEVTDAENGPA